MTWIKISGKKPEINKRVSVKCGKKWESIGMLLESGSWQISENKKETVTSDKPTHWKDNG